MENLLKVAADRKTNTLVKKSRFYKNLTDLNSRSEFKTIYIKYKSKVPYATFKNQMHRYMAG